MDIHSIKVSDTTGPNRKRYGYEYFSSKEEMVAKAIIWSEKTVSEDHGDPENDRK